MLPHLEPSLTSEYILSGNGEMSAGLTPSVGAVLEPGDANEAVLQSRAPKHSANCWVPLDHAYTHGQQGTDDQGSRQHIKLRGKEPINQCIMGTEERLRPATLFPSKPHSQNASLLPSVS